MDIKKRQPILEGLQYETAEDKANAERAQPSLWKAVSLVFDVRIDGRANPRNDACYQAHPNGKGPGVIDVMDKGATDKSTSDVADSADHRSPKLTTREPRSPSRHMIHGRMHAARVRENLADRDEEAKCDCESNAYNPV